MSRSLLALALVAASGTAASAGTYLGLGIGTDASVGGNMNNLSSDGSRTGRLILGQRIGRFSVEGTGWRYSFFQGPAAYDGQSLGIAGKFSLPLGNNFEAFGRLGLQRTWLTTGYTNRMDFAGNGWLLGAGFEYRLDIGLTAASIFVDYQRDQTSFDHADHQPAIDASAGVWSVGATFGI